MDEMKYRRDELLAIIKQNREAHRQEFEIAIAGYEAEAIQRLQGLVKQLKAGKLPHISVALAVPQDHTKDYDRVIRMLEMSIDSDITLSEHEFGQCVQDDWPWKGQFMATNSAYYEAGTTAMASKLKK